MTQQPTFTLRAYQKSFVQKLSIKVLNENSVIACAPTGSGKSKMMASIAMRATSRGKVVLIMTESTKIYDQLVTELPVTEIKAGVKHVHVEPSRVYLAMVQTLTRRPQIIEDFIALGNEVLVLNDEAHIGTATKLLRRLKETAYIIGFTATPHYFAAKFLPEIYNACVQACQVDDLIQDGFLCTYRHIARDKVANLDVLEVRGEDYSEASNEKAFGTSEVYDGLIEDLRKYPYKKAMVFTASIKQCEATYNMLVENGFRVCRYHSGNKDYPLTNLDYELAKFKELNLCDICVSVSSLTKGFDFPPIDLVAILRKTKSLPLYLQMIGRASRPVTMEQAIKEGWDKFMTEPKKSFICLDYASHWKTLGLYWDNRDWETLWLPPPTKRKKEPGGVSMVKACENCDELIPIQAQVCKHCGYKYPLIHKDLAIGEAIEVTEHYTRILGKLTSELDPYELAVYAKMKNKKAHAIRIAMHKEQKDSGFIKRFGEYMGMRKDWIYTTTRDALLVPVNDFYDVELK